MTSAQVAKQLQHTHLSIISSSYRRIVNSQWNRWRLSLEMSPGTCMSAINKCLLLPCLNTDNTLYKQAVNKPSSHGSENTRQNKNQHKFTAAQGIRALKMVIYEDNPDPLFLQNTKILHNPLEQCHFPNNSSKMNGCLFKPKRKVKSLSKQIFLSARDLWLCPTTIALFSFQ